MKRAFSNVTYFAFMSKPRRRKKFFYHEVQKRVYSSTFSSNSDAPVFFSKSEFIFLRSHFIVELEKILYHCTNHTPTKQNLNTIKIIHQSYITLFVKRNVRVSLLKSDLKYKKVFNFFLTKLAIKNQSK